RGGRACVACARIAVGGSGFGVAGPAFGLGRGCEGDDVRRLVALLGVERVRLVDVGLAALIAGSFAVVARFAAFAGGGLLVGGAGCALVLALRPVDGEVGVVVGDVGLELGGVGAAQAGDDRVEQDVLAVEHAEPHRVAEAALHLGVVRREVGAHGDALDGG